MKSPFSPDFVRAMMEEEDRPKPAPVAPDVERARLLEAFAVYHRTSAMAPGDMVQHKVGIAIATARGGPPTGIFVVMEVRPEAETNWSSDLSLYGVKFDLCLGYYDEDGDFIFRWTDSRRYEKAAP